MTGFWTWIAATGWCCIRPTTSRERASNEAQLKLKAKGAEIQQEIGDLLKETSAAARFPARACRSIWCASGCGRRTRSRRDFGRS